MIAWAHSSFSSDSVNCVEAGRGSVVWSRSSRCAGGDCLEAVRTSGAHEGVLVRDSKEGPAGFRIQMWPSMEWADLLIAVRLRQPHPAIDRLDDGSVLLGLATLSDRHEILHYSETEWTAFELGAIAGEFEHSVLPDVGEWSRPSACTCNKLSGPASVGTGGAGRTVEPSDGGSDQAATGADVTVPDTALVAADSLYSPAGRPVDASSGVKASVVAGQPGSSSPVSNQEDLPLISWSEDPSLGEPQGPGKGAARRAGQGPVLADRSSVEAAGTGALPPALVPVAQADRHELPEFNAEAMALFREAYDLRGLYFAARTVAQWAYQAGWSDREKWTEAVAPLVPTDGAS